MRGSKVNQHQPILVRFTMQAEPPNCRPKGFFSPYLGIEIADHDFDIVLRTISVCLFKLCIESLFLLVRSFVVWRMRIDNAIMEELTAHPKHAESSVDRAPADDTPTPFSIYKKAGSEGSSFAAATQHGKTIAFEFILAAPSSLLEGGN